MASLLKTSRTQVDRILDAKNDITLSSLQRVAAIVGRRVTIELGVEHTAGKSALDAAQYQQSRQVLTCSCVKLLPQTTVAMRL